MVFSRQKTASSYFKDFTHCGNLSSPVNCDENSERVYCETCEKWYHYQCKNLTKKAYKELIKSNKSFFCPDRCNQSLFPFYNLNLLEFLDQCSPENSTPCKKCKLACLGNGLMNCIQCDICDHWFHEECANLEYSIESYFDFDLGFICSDKCQLSLLPFNSVTKNADIPEFNPSIDSYPCKICREECLGFHLMDCVQCSICHYWIHSNCLNLSQQEFEILANSNLEFICSKRCEMLLFPFHSLSSESNILDSFESIDNNSLLSSKTNQAPQSPKSYQLNNQSNYFDQFLDINCSYVKPECLKDDYFKSSNSELVVMHNNICSLPSNFHKVEELFIGSNYRPHIIALSETKLNSSSVVPTLKGYSFEHVDSPTAAGGVGFYLSDSLQYTICEDLALGLPNCEDLWINIKFNGSQPYSKPNPKNIQNLVVGIIYRHPGRKYDEFREKLSNQMLLLNQKKIKYYIVGDINIDLMKYNTASNITNYLNALHSVGCNVFTDKPTRITSHSGTCIDHIYSNLST